MWIILGLAWLASAVLVVRPDLLNATTLRTKLQINTVAMLGAVIYFLSAPSILALFFVFCVYALEGRYLAAAHAEVPIPALEKYVGTTSREVSNRFVVSVALCIFSVWILLNVPSATFGWLVLTSGTAAFFFGSFLEYKQFPLDARFVFPPDDKTQK